MKYYRGRFMIGIYSLLHEGETLLALCESVKEFAEFLDISENCAWASLSQLYSGYKKFIKLNGKLRTVEFIEVEE